MNLPTFPGHDSTNNNIDPTIIPELRSINSSFTNRRSTKKNSTSMKPTSMKSTSMKSTSMKSTSKKSTKKNSASSSSKTTHPPPNNAAPEQPAQDHSVPIPDEPDAIDYTTHESHKSFTELMSDAPDFMEGYTDYVIQEFRDPEPTFFDQVESYQAEIDRNPHLYGLDDPVLAEGAGIQGFPNGLEPIAETVDQPSIQQQPPRPLAFDYQQTPQSNVLYHPSGSSSSGAQPSI
ncbi:hypothetical protein NW752_011600 [Fusarium irregulare]|uniref:Uncharacterized protein n=1 Tax=Fusarium irregulare TaxID=2494466 RepID=A0A9W8PDL6_9HYPO|nr:hypothetical protein NW766_012541 [Fusarium irregulare]KAJ4004503.1 hypothetical protein NW752_011600 [Fusarium irregulare]